MLERTGLTQKIFKIAIPSIIGYLGLTLFEVVDIYWIGKINSKAVAAAGACAFIEWMLYSIMNLSITGCATLVSQYIGAKKDLEKFKVIIESSWASLIISAVVILILFPLREKIFVLMGLDTETTAFALQYFTVLLLGFPIIYLLSLSGNIFNAYGDTKTSTIVLVGTIFINMGLDPCLIFGWSVFPKLGIQGAAIASISSMFLGLIIRAYLLRKKNFIPPLKDFFNISFSYLKRFVQIGFPSGATNMIWSAVFPMLTVIVTKFGMAPLASLNICNRLEGIPYFFSVGFSIAMATLVGQHYGAKQYKEVRQIVIRGGILIVLLLMPVSFLFVFIPEQLIMLMNDDPMLIKHGAEYLRIVGYFEIFLGLEVAFEGAFNGLGNTKPYMFIRVPLTLLRVPLAWFFAIYLKMGPSGVWWAVSMTTAIKGTLMVISFISNKKNREMLTAE